jgi:hypothetical protein
MTGIWAEGLDMVVVVVFDGKILGTWLWLLVRHDSADRISCLPASPVIIATHHFLWYATCTLSSCQIIFGIIHVTLEAANNSCPEEYIVHFILAL